MQQWEAEKAKRDAERKRQKEEAEAAAYKKKLDDARRKEEEEKVPVGAGQCCRSANCDAVTRDIWRSWLSYRGKALRRITRENPKGKAVRGPKLQRRRCPLPS